MSMSGVNKQVKVRYIHEDSYGLKKGEIYDAYLCNSKLGQTDVVSVIDQFGEEYAYPLAWFDIID